MSNETATAVDLEPMQRLTRDLANAAKTLSHGEARFLVDAYYQMQEDRIRSANQVRALADDEEPNEVLRWLFEQSSTLEKQIQRALDRYTDAHVVGRWARSIVGVGPIIAAGLLAHISMEPWTCVQPDRENRCNRREPCSPACKPQRLTTVGKIWRYAGLDPTSVWEQGKKRPWNAALKTLTWKMGESFVKQSGHAEDVYGKLYVSRKAAETARNISGAYAQQAAEKLVKVNFGRDTDARIWLEGRLSEAAVQKYFETPPERRVQGLAKKLAGEPGSGYQMLSPAHVHARAKRYAVKIFLAHWHAVAYRAKFNEDAPKPYVISILGHADEIKCPNWPFDKA